MADALEVVLHASGAETADNSGSPVDIGALRSAARLRFDVSAFSAQELLVVVETGPSSSGPWQPVDSFETARTVGFQEKAFVGLQRYVRARWELGGSSPSATFALGGPAEVVYAGPQDIAGLIQSKALDNIPKAVIAGACLDATGEAEGEIQNVHKLPLVAWGRALRLATARIALPMVLDQRGRQPNGPNDRVGQIEKLGRDWLQRLGKGQVSDPDLVDSTPATPTRPRARISSSESRGW